MSVPGAPAHAAERLRGARNGRAFATERGLPPPLARPVVSVSLVLMLVPTFLRVLLPSDPFPIWDVNPFKFPAPTVGITPSLSLWLDVMTILGSALAIVISPFRVRIWEVALYAIGAAVVALHALGIDGGSLDNLRVGSGWASALAAGIGVRTLASDAAVRRWLFAVVLGCSMPLAIHSLVQVYIEHPATVASYRANPSAFLEAQGWTPGSASARNYERRLMQPEATGWFGMANVHATFGAAFVIGWFGVIIARVRGETLAHGRGGAAPERIRGEPILIAAMVLLSVVMLFLTRSKGGYAAAGLGLGMLVFATFFMARAWDAFERVSSSGARWRSLLPPMIGPLVMIGVIMAIVARGAAGTRIGELSLLFRWFYISAATRIFADSPLLGVGPADFRPAYELAKNPLSPEEVTSPHSLPFDWISTLGLGGVAWVALLVVLAIAVGRGLMPRGGREERSAVTGVAVSSERKSGGRPLGAHAAIAAAVVLIPCGVAFVIELSGYAEVLMMGTTIGDMAIVLGQSRVPGAILWLLATALVLARPIADHVLRPVLACIGVSLLASACIDLAPVWANSAALYFVTLGLAAGGLGETLGPQRRSVRLSAGAIVLAGCVAPLLGLASVLGWEQHLHRAGRPARAYGVLVSERRMIEAMGPEKRAEAIERWRNRSLASIRMSEGGSQWAESIRGLGPRAFSDDDVILRYLFLSHTQNVAEDLQAAATEGFDHPKTFLAAAEAALFARTMSDRGEDAPPAPEVMWIIDLARSGAERPPASSSAWGAYARIGLEARLAGSPGAGIQDAALAEARSALERAAALDPHGITYPLQLYQLATSTGDRDLQRRWGEELLRRNANMKLDPLRALTPEEVGRVEASLRPSP